MSTRHTPEHQLSILTQTATVLIGTMKPDWENIRKGAYWRQFNQPVWWLPAVPTYLGLRSGTRANISKNLIRLLRAVAENLASTDLTRTYTDDDAGPSLELYPELHIAYRLVMSTWKDGILFLTHEMDYFWEQAIDGPHVGDFTRLKASKLYAETMYQDLGAWITHMEEMLNPKRDRSGARAMSELQDLLSQVSEFKQEISDTFQLLIGAIAIKDSEIQRSWRAKASFKHVDPQHLQHLLQSICHSL